MTFWIPESFRPRCRPFAAQGLEGWVDVEFFEALEEPQRRAPLSLLDLPGAQRIKDSRNALARATVGSGAQSRAIWIKRFRPRGPLSWAQRAFRSGKAERAWNTAFALLAEGISTPRPLMGLRGKGRFGGPWGLLVVEDAGVALPLRQRLRQTKPGAEDRRRLIEGLAAFVSRMHEKGFCHRDLSGGNILVGEAKGGQPAFTLLDINRMRRFPALSGRQRLRDLERINLAEGDLGHFFAVYTAGNERLARLHDAYQARAERYRRMRSTRSPLERLRLKARYYWDEIRG